MAHQPQLDLETAEIQWNVKAPFSQPTAEGESIRPDTYEASHLPRPGAG